jgi:hypothetical protein
LIDFDHCAGRPNPAIVHLTASLIFKEVQLRRFAIFLSAVLMALFLAPAAPASASAFEWNTVVAHEWSGHYVDNCQQNFLPSAQGCFLANGDWLGIADIFADGMSAGMHWQTNYDRKGICTQPHGQDSIVASIITGSWACNKNMREGEKIRIRVGRCNGSAHSCTVLANWQDWSGWSPWLTI